MPQHFGSLVGRDDADDQMNRCIAADDCVRIAYAGPDKTLGSISRTGTGGRTVARTDVAAMQMALRGVAPATWLQIDGGVRTAAQIAIGDVLIGTDGKQVAVEGICVHEFGWRTLGVNPFLRPVRIAENAFGPGCPSEDVTMAPGQLVVVGAYGEAPVPAYTLLGRTGVSRPEVLAARYIDVTLSDGMLTLTMDGQMSGAAVGVADPAIRAA